MTLWSALVAIVAIIAFASLRSARYRQQSGSAPSALPESSAALEREVLELRRRIEVLERIVTDERETSRLAQDIEALRSR